MSSCVSQLGVMINDMSKILTTHRSAYIIHEIYTKKEFYDVTRFLSVHLDFLLRYSSYCILSVVLLGGT